MLLAGTRLVRTVTSAFFLMLRFECALMIFLRVAFGYGFLPTSAIFVSSVDDKELGSTMNDNNAS